MNKRDVPTKKCEINQSRAVEIFFMRSLSFHFFFLCRSRMSYTKTTMVQ